MFEGYVSFRECISLNFVKQFPKFFLVVGKHLFVFVLLAICYCVSVELTLLFQDVFGGRNAHSKDTLEDFGQNLKFCEWGFFVSTVFHG